jgi:hypothetical protein
MLNFIKFQSPHRWMKEGCHRIDAFVVVSFEAIKVVHAQLCLISQSERCR